MGEGGESGRGNLHNAWPICSRFVTARHLCARSLFRSAAPQTVVPSRFHLPLPFPLSLSLSGTPDSAASHNLSCEKLLKLQDLHFYFHVERPRNRRRRRSACVPSVKLGSGRGGSEMRGTCCFAIFLFLVYVLFFCSLRFFVTILHIFLFNNEATIGKRQLVRGVEGGEGLCRVA